ncbi:DUF6185 family protein [Streptomyces phaeoluteigriseus]|uniref:DUF6185 family protein n=1 Tax=Streptomyces phaeoluteigriseus TaxID=114686 RepID=UPI001FE8DAB1|nr:DUF6185 family protein [Streptomyces phaeoluteigriseus]
MTVLGGWADRVRGKAWQVTLADQFGLPGLLLALFYWLSTGGVAGFVLGALWRVLPGRRGAVKALPVAPAFALPSGWTPRPAGSRRRAPQFSLTMPRRCSSISSSPS